MGTPTELYQYTWNVVSSFLMAFMNGHLHLDIACEMIESLADLGGRPRTSELLQRAREKVVQEGQNADGSFGDYDRMQEEQRAVRGNPRYDVRIGGTLHTTMVCLRSLIRSSDATPPIREAIGPDVATDAGDAPRAALDYQSSSKPSKAQGK